MDKGTKVLLAVCVVVWAATAAVAWRNSSAPELEDQIEWDDCQRFAPADFRCINRAT